MLTSGTSNATWWWYSPIRYLWIDLIWWGWDRPDRGRRSCTGPSSFWGLQFSRPKFLSDISSPDRRPTTSRPSEVVRDESAACRRRRPFLGLALLFGSSEADWGCGLKAFLRRRRKKVENSGLSSFVLQNTSLLRFSVKKFSKNV